MKRVSLRRAIIKNLKETYKNKLTAILLMVLGVSAVVLEDYIGLCVISMIIGLWLFFRKENIFD